MEDKEARAPLFSRTQAVVLLALAGVLVAGLWGIRHRRLSRASDIRLVAGDAAEYAFKIAINSATAEELALLPGVGPKKAEAILAERARSGPFRSAKDLDRVPGIGERSAQEMGRYLTFEAAR